MLNAPLEDAELDELQQIMMSWPAEDALEVSGLHGLLTAVVSSPETVMPSEWLPVVLGSYVFETQAEAQRVITLIMRFMNEIVDTLINEPEAYEPLLLEQKRARSTPAFAGAWCYGYLEGVQLRSAAWEPFLDEAGVGYAVETILRLVDDVPGKRLTRRAERHRELAAAAATIHRFFYDRRRKARTYRAEVIPIGRNERCTCGSGKKYKKCCGGG